MVANDQIKTPSSFFSTWSWNSMLWPHEGQVMVRISVGFLWWSWVRTVVLLVEVGVIVGATSWSIPLSSSESLHHVISFSYAHISQNRSLISFTPPYNNITKEGKRKEKKKLNTKKNIREGATKKGKDKLKLIHTLVSFKTRFSWFTSCFW